MKKKELKIILEAQLPKSYQSIKASVEDEQQGVQLHKTTYMLMTAGQDADSEFTESTKTEAQPGRFTSSNSTYACLAVTISGR